MGAITIRVASPDDAPALRGIYAPYVEETAITFEYEVPTEAELRRRIGATGARYPYLVAEQDGTTLGYAYLSPFVGRAAYDWAAETSIYLRQDRAIAGWDGGCTRPWNGAPGRRASGRFTPASATRRRRTPTSRAAARSSTSTLATPSSGGAIGAAISSRPGTT